MIILKIPLEAQNWSQLVMSLNVTKIWRRKQFEFSFLLALDMFCFEAMLQLIRHTLLLSDQFNLYKKMK